MPECSICERDLSKRSPQSNEFSQEGEGGRRSGATSLTTTDRRTGSTQRASRTYASTASPNSVSVNGAPLRERRRTHTQTRHVARIG